MPSFQITIAPHRRAAARFISTARRELQKAFAEEKKKRGLNQSEIARMLGVHRTVVHRELRGQSDLSLGRVAELAHALGRVVKFSLADAIPTAGQNEPHVSNVKVESSSNSRAAIFSVADSNAGQFIQIPARAA